jgi:hypothetical protein
MQVVNGSKVLDYNPYGIVFINCLDDPDFMSWAGKVIDIYHFLESLFTISFSCIVCRTPVAS